MSKKTFLVLVGFAFLFSFNLAQADVIINEVQIGGTTADDEFIELYNSSSSDVDLTNWYINKKSSTGNESTLVVKSRLENKSITSNSYFLLAKENGYVGNATPDVLWPSSYSLANNNSVILYKGNETDKDQTSWESIENGKSIQKQSDNSWVVATPTPGAENQISEDNEEEEQTEDTVTGSSGSSKKTETKEPETPLVNKTKITAQIPAFVGLPVQFKASNTVSDKSCGKYSLNFGDGNSLETEKTFPIPEKFSHIYYYPGEYIVTLECYESYLSAEPDSSDKIIVKVISSEVVISKIGDAKDFFIEISNNAPFEADISGWVLISYQNKFVFPKNTIIKSKNKIIVSPKTTNFSILDKETLKLIDSEGKTVFDYSSAKPIRILARNPTQAKVSASEPTRNAFSIADAGGNNTNINVPVSTGVSLGGPVDNLLAGAIKSDVNTGNNIKYGMFGLFALLGIGTSTAYFIRNRNRKSVPETIGSDFEIIDE